MSVHTPLLILKGTFYLSGQWETWLHLYEYVFTTVTTRGYRLSGIQFRAQCFIFSSAKCFHHLQALLPGVSVCVQRQRKPQTAKNVSATQLLKMSFTPHGRRTLFRDIPTDQIVGAVAHLTICPGHYLSHYASYCRINCKVIGW